MALLQIRLFGDPVLRQTARTVTDFDRRLQRLAEDMLDSMRAAPGVGLAAPQVGVLKRLFTWEVEDRSGAVANPQLTDASDEHLLDDEGCLSFPGLYCPVRRPLRAEVRFQDLGGDDRSIQLEGLPARVWLHEMDHLDGVLFIDHLAKHDRRAAMRAMRELRAQAGDQVDRPAGGLLLGRRSRPQGDDATPPREPTGAARGGPA